MALTPSSLGALADGLLATCGTRDHLLRYYSRDRLFSDAARQGWVAPDLADLPAAPSAESRLVETPGPGRDGRD